MHARDVHLADCARINGQYRSWLRSRDSYRQTRMGPCIFPAPSDPGSGALCRHIGTDLLLGERIGDFSLIEPIQWSGAVADLKPESAGEANFAESFKAEARHAGLRSPYRITPVRD
jgi:hypothetical protein